MSLSGGVPAAHVGDEKRQLGPCVNPDCDADGECTCPGDRGFVGPVEPVADTVGVNAADMRGNLTKMIADVIAMHPCYRDVDGHQGADCPQARAVIESLSRPPALRALVELAPDHPRKPVLPEPRPVAEKSSNEFRNVVLDRAAAIARGASS